MTTESYTIGRLKLARDTHPVIARTWGAWVTIGEGDTKQKTMLDLADLRVMAAAATAIADSITFDHKDD